MIEGGRSGEPSPEFTRIIEKRKLRGKKLLPPSDESVLPLISGPTLSGEALEARRVLLSRISRSDGENTDNSGQ